MESWASSLKRLSGGGCDSGSGAASLLNGAGKPELLD